MQAAQAHVRPFPAVVVGDLVGSASRGHVHLDGDQVRLVIEGQGLHVFVLDLGVVVRFDNTDSNRAPKVTATPDSSSQRVRIASATCGSGPA